MHSSVYNLWNALGAGMNRDELSLTCMYGSYAMLGLSINMPKEPSLEEGSELASAAL